MALLDWEVVRHLTLNKIFILTHSFTMRKNGVVVPWDDDPAYESDLRSFEEDYAVLSQILQFESDCIQSDWEALLRESEPNFNLWGLPDWSCYNV